MFQRKYIEIDETWEEKDGHVYRLWRFANETEWRRELMPYNQIPVFHIKLGKVPGE